MDSTYGIAYYNISFENESDILQIQKNYIWSINTFYSIDDCGFFDDKHIVRKGNLGSLIFGEIYKLNRNEILEIIKANVDYFKSFNKTLLSQEYYYFVWEDWS